MNCIVTAGPTYEKMDQVRRLTNFSTGRLGIELARFLTERGHDVTLLVGEQATYGGERRANRIETFATTSDLREWFRALADAGAEAIFHTAAVSDFSFGKIWLRLPDGEMSELKSGKISTRQGTLMAELVPTPKIISELRDWYPKTQIIGWKYEVEGDQAAVIAAAARQLHECLTDACVANGPAYGEGFGIVVPNGKVTHLDTIPGLFDALEARVRK
ncbi:MAG TPA: phosphopantothenoylcysteine decarboxylase [Verrucomicrobiae bacterium]|nr:phosphopantothenoylcysteine decarboxylase [Verrucomicrobiae bacterium]